MSNLIASKRVFAGVSICGVLFCRALIADAPPAPAATVAAFTAALEDGNTAKLSTLVTGEENEKAWVLAYGAQLHAFGQFEQALNKRFGAAYAEDDAGKEISGQLESDRDQDFIAALKHASIGSVDGDAVQINIDPTVSAGLQGRLVKSEGRWVVDLDSLTNYFSTDDTAGLQAMATAATALAKDVEAGKFATISDADEAAKDRLGKAETQWVSKTRPANSSNPMHK